MAERQQVCGESNSEEKQMKATSRSRRSKKATNMSFEEMVEMVDILMKTDYDGKHGPYSKPNARKDKIMEKVLRSLHRKFGVRRNKEQLRKRWSDIKLREEDQYRKIKKVLRKREKRREKYELSVDTSNPAPPEDQESQPIRHPEGDVDADVQEVLCKVLQSVSTTSQCLRPQLQVRDGCLHISNTLCVLYFVDDLDVVEDKTPFSSASAHMLMSELLVCNRELEKIKENIHDIQNRVITVIKIFAKI
ncbi:uncharacterized protein [Aquarana catesbeiana]|uniref:uncharacterized protein n=1 Tax=Aquarana catesbeiana TaxID=8400 RepID=UPI003CC99EAC